MPDDPRDRGFNYGRGWGSDPKPPLYHTATIKCRQLSEQANRLSQEAWDLEHALWVVRIASTGEEKAIAMNHLAEKMAKYQDQKVEAA
jgi:hypothetical protein